MLTPDSVTAAHYVGAHIITDRTSSCVLPQTLRAVLVVVGNSVTVWPEEA